MLGRWVGGVVVDGWRERSPLPPKGFSAQAIKTNDRVRTVLMRQLERHFFHLVLAIKVLMAEIDVVH